MWLNLIKQLAAEITESDVPALEKLPGNGNGAGISSSADVMEIIGWGIAMAGLVAVIFIVIGGISYINSRGDAGKLANAKRTILWAVIGLLIVVLAEAITFFVSSSVGALNAPILAMLGGCA